MTPSSLGDRAFRDGRVAEPNRGPAVRVSRLTKRFGSILAVDDISFEVARGEVFAFLGPNGAGKSTTIKMLCTLTRPSAGEVAVAGFDAVSQPRAVRRRLGLVFQEQTLDDQLTANENLRFHAVLYGMPPAQIEPRIASLLSLVGLGERGDDLVATYSGGMARRLEIARALLHTPDVLFLDEPTLGLDPQTRALMWRDVLRLRDEQGVTVFLTTHYLDEAEYADRVAIIDRGRIVAAGTPAELKANLGQDAVELITADNAAALAELQAAGFTVAATSDGLRVQANDGEAVVARIVAATDIPIRHVHVRRPTLDDVFLQVTGREIRDRPGERGSLTSARVRAFHRRR